MRYNNSDGDERVTMLRAAMRLISIEVEVLGVGSGSCWAVLL